MKNLLFYFMVAFLFACDGQVQKQKNQEAFEQERKARTLKVLSEADILTGAQALGSKILESSQRVLISKLTGAIQAGEVIGALSFCKIEALPILDSLSKEYNSQIKRVTFKPRNQTNYPDSLEIPILDAYEYSVSKGDQPSINVQVIDNSTFLITSPIVINNSLCLQCHGEPGKDLTKDVLQNLSQIYPNDKAKGYKLGDLRGMWSLKLSKKEVVNSL